MPSTPVSPLQQLRNLVSSFRKEARPEVKQPEQLVDPRQPKDWTVLAYMEGRDRLSHSVEVALNGMEEIGSTDSVNLVAQATLVPEFGDRRFQSSGETNTRRYYLTEDHDLHTIKSPVLQEFGEQKKLNEETLEDFLTWGVEKFPARHFMVVLKKHGLGFAANGSSVPLSARELRETLERVEKKTGVKPDVLCWDSCNMQQWEVAYELKDRAQVITGSPEAIPAVEFPYPTMLHNLARYPKQQNAQTMGRTIVQSYAAEAPQTTQIALDSKEVATVGQDMKAFVDSVLKAGVSRERLYTNLMKSASFEPRESLGLAYNFRDVAGFLKEIVADPSIGSQEVKDRAKAVLSHMRQASVDSNISPERAHLKHLSEEAGPSAFLPWKKPSQKLRESYSHLQWAKDTGWDKLLDYTLGEPPAKADATSSEHPHDAGHLGLYLYKKYVSPYLLTDCPYDVSCSEYARQALENMGPVEGAKWAFMRLISCHDGAVGGADDPPGHHHHHHAEKLPELTLTPPAPVEKSNFRRRAEDALFAASRLTGKVVGGTVAAAVGGVAGAVLGGLWGSKAGGGTLQAFNHELRAKYGDTKVAALERLQNPVANPAATVGSAAKKFLGETVGNAVGSAAGGLTGAAMGLAGGALFSFRFFGGFAALAAQNMAKDAVGELPVHYQTEQILRAGYSHADR